MRTISFIRLQEVTFSFHLLASWKWKTKAFQKYSASLQLKVTKLSNTKENHKEVRP